MRESLNNRVGNNGIFNENQANKSGNTPNDNLGALLVSPGKAVVRGYSLETIDTTIVDFEKDKNNR